MTVTQFYVDLLQCNNACPAGENIKGWLGLAWAGSERAPPWASSGESDKGKSLNEATPWI
jgi:hypothetical protein